MPDPGTQSILEAYVGGRITWPQLLSRLRELVDTGHTTREAMLAELDQAVRRNVLSGDLAVALRQGITGPPEMPTPPSNDATRIKAPQSATRSDEATLGQFAGVRGQETRSGTPAPESPTGPAAEGDSQVSDWSRLAYEQAPAPEVGPGTVLNKRFTLEDVLGQGGMGTVFRARDSVWQEAGDKNPYVAVKVLGDEFKRHPQALVALQREAGKARSLAHPNIITVYDYDRDGQTVYMTMELLDGEPLDRMISGSAAKGGLSMQKVLPIVRGISNALIYAHEKGIVHSDLKPSNVFVSRQGAVKVLDFGIARAIWSPDRFDAKDTMFDAREIGALTPAYASPEMLLDLDPHPRDDVYALACVTYELLAGRHPFDRMPAHLAMHAGLRVKPIPGVKRRQMKALERGLAFTRGRRTATVQEFIRELEASKVAGRGLRRAAVAAAVIALGGAGYLGYYMSQACERIDEAFLDDLPASFLASLEDDNRQLPRTISSPEGMRRYLEQGQRYLESAEKAFNPADLSEATSTNALRLFETVLAAYPQNAEARAGVLAVIDRYDREARRLLDAGDVDKAAEIAAIGLRIHPQHCGLRETQQAASAAADLGYRPARPDTENLFAACTN